MNKRILAFLATTLALVCISAPASAAGLPANLTAPAVEAGYQAPNVPYIIVIDENGQAAIEPRFQYLFSLFTDCGLSSESANTLVCQANCTMNEPGYTVKLEIILQKSTNGTSWSKLTSWSEKFGTGTNTLTPKYRDLPTGYIYRLKTTAYVYNKSGRLVEQDTVYSQEVEN